MVIRSCVALIVVSLLSLIAAFAVPHAVHAQQPGRTLVTLLTGDRGMVDARAMATKDIVAQVTTQRGSRAGLHIVTIQTCPKVPPGIIQGMMKDLQARTFMVALDLKDADPRLCLR